MKNIGTLFLFDGLSEQQKSEILSSLSEPVHFSKGEVIYATDRFDKAIGFLLSGSAYAIADNSNRVVMRKFAPGMCFGAAALFGCSENYVSTVTAKTDTDIQFLHEEEIRNLFLRYPKTAVNYISFLSDKIRFLNARLSVLSCGNAEKTVYQYLLSVTDESGTAQLPKSMTLLSKMLGLGRASLYRALGSLEKSGFIKRENNQIKVIENEKMD